MSGSRPDDSALEALVDSWLADGTPSGGDAGSVDGTPPDGTPDGTTPNDGTPTPNAEPTQPDAGITSGQPPAKPTAPQQAGTPAKPVKPGGDGQRPAQQPAKPGSGDLVDREGRVIAKAGQERRFYEEANRAKTDLGKFKEQLRTVEGQLQAFREAASMPTQLGLTPDETTLGLQLAASWKANPTGVIKYLLEQATAAGHSVEDIGIGIAPAAIKTMIANELAPFRQQALGIQQTNEARTAAEGQINSLVGEYGDGAMANADALSSLIDASQAAGRPMTLESAYLRFANWCLGKGYDPHQPLQPQMAQQPAATPAPTEQRNTQPRPNGRAVATPTGVVPIDHGAGLTGSETTKDLVRASMREAGFNIQ